AGGGSARSTAAERGASAGREERRRLGGNRTRSGAERPQARGALDVSRGAEVLFREPRSLEGGWKARTLVALGGSGRQRRRRRRRSAGDEMAGGGVRARRHRHGNAVLPRA